jgi:UDPglucose 6-dehydrogenase
VCPDAEFDVASNPEFLREGAAVNDFMRPDRVVIGTSSERARKVLQEVYRPLYLNETPLVFTRRETAEIIKYAANAFLATKITFINEIADLCEKAGGDVQVVARALGLDGRISPKFLHAGPGYGGSCFPKDTLALAQTGEKMNARQKIVETVVSVNAERQDNMADRIITSCGGDVKGKTIGILGVAFKPNTDDVREAPSLRIIPILQEAGAIIKAYDPAAMEEAKKHLSNIDWKKNAYDVAENAHALVIITEWNEFRAMDLTKISDLMEEKRLIDLRNIYKTGDMENSGFHYVSIGRPEVLPSKVVAIKEVSNG